MIVTAIVGDAVGAVVGGFLFGILLGGTGATGFNVCCILWLATVGAIERLLLHMPDR